MTREFAFIVSEDISLLEKRGLAVLAEQRQRSQTAALKGGIGRGTLVADLVMSPIIGTSNYRGFIDTCTGDSSCDCDSITCDSCAM